MATGVHSQPISIEMARADCIRSSDKRQLVKPLSRAQCTRGIVLRDSTGTVDDTCSLVSTETLNRPTTYWPRSRLD